MYLKTSIKADISYFPYKLREFQAEFIHYIQKNIKNRDIIVDAATGFGKTPLILASLLPISLNKKRKILWAVRTGTETDRPIEELKKINNFSDEKIFGLSFRGKKDMCLLWKDLNLKGELEHDDISFLCKLHQKDCKYLLNYKYGKIDLIEIINTPLLYSEILKFCEKEEICPYRLQLDLIPFADVIALNYNYIISKDIGWVLQNRINYSDSFLVIDEAHNLQNVCSNLNSDQITIGTIRNSLKEIDEIGIEGAKEICRFLNLMKSYFKETLEKITDEDIEFNVYECIKKCSNNLDSFIKIIRKIHKYGMLIRRRKLVNGKAPRSSLYHLSNFWISAISNMNIDGIAFIASKEEGKHKNLIVEMWDMRSNVILKNIWKKFHRCIFCSGTLKPIDSFAEIIGLEEYIGETFPSSFLENAFSLITKDLTSEGEELSEKMAKSYLKAIDIFIKNLKTNIAIFSASYRIQNTLLEYGLRETIEKNGRKFFLETKEISGKTSRKILDEFKACAKGPIKGVLCATMTGRYAEGADFPGKELEGIFLVGVPFDKLTIKTKLYIEYYQKIYGKEKGTFYAYVLPAIKRASQALGRALRSKEDYALFILGDKRYINFIHYLPDFIQKNFKIIKSDSNDIIKEVKTFKIYMERKDKEKLVTKLI
ncbi:MAG: helicase C-terminal domain-containing protein [Nitrososphaerota archaeon]